MDLLSDKSGSAAPIIIRPFAKWDAEFFLPWDVSLSEQQGTERAKQ